MTDELNIIDWHGHHVPARFELTALSMAPPSQRARWEAIERKLRDEDLMVKDTRDGVLGARVINIPANLIADANGLVARPTLEVASRLGVPVFIHPVAPQPLTKQMTRFPSKSCRGPRARAAGARS